MKVAIKRQNTQILFAHMQSCYLFVINICDIPAIDHSGVSHRGISGMSHKVSVWQATQLPNIQSCLSPCLPLCSNLPNSVENPTAVHPRKNSKHLLE